MNKRLDREQWIGAALRAAARHGIDGVRVERLAEELGVTKGSFYWHFKDRNALLETVLEAWRARATNDIIGEVEARGGDPAARLLHLIAIVGQGDGRLDQVIRTWAANDHTAARALAEVDRRRLDYLKTLFLGIGFQPSAAGARARLVYHAIIGQFTLSPPASRRERLKEWLDVIYPMLVRRGR